MTFPEKLYEKAYFEPETEFKINEYVILELFNLFNVDPSFAIRNHNCNNIFAMADSDFYIFWI